MSGLGAPSARRALAEDQQATPGAAENAGARGCSAPGVVSKRWGAGRGKARYRVRPIDADAARFELAAASHLFRRLFGDVEQFNRLLELLDQPKVFVRVVLDSADVGVCFGDGGRVGVDVGGDVGLEALEDADAVLHPLQRGASRVRRFLPKDEGGEGWRHESAISGPTKGEKKLRRPAGWRRARRGDKAAKRRLIFKSATSPVTTCAKRPTTGGGGSGVRRSFARVPSLAEAPPCVWA